MTVTLLVPTLNEIEGMRKIMPQVRREWVDQILVVDGGSTDGTIEYALAQGLEVFGQPRPGLRQAMIDAMPYCRGEIIVTFSPDGNSIPELIPELIAKIREGNDLVIASRYVGGAKSQDDDLVTSFGNWYFTGLLNLLLGSRYTDIMVMYRTFRKQIVYDLGLDREESYAPIEKLFFTRLGWEPLMCVRAAKARLPVVEIPGDEPRRLGGQRKLQIIRWGLAYHYQFFREFLRR